MRILVFLPVGAILVIATACGGATQGAAAPKALEVLVADVPQKDAPLYREWIGRVDGSVNAEIETQVSGYLVKQEYSEGSFVRQGQLISGSIPGHFSRTWIGLTSTSGRARDPIPLPLPAIAHRNPE